MRIRLQGSRSWREEQARACVVQGVHVHQLDARRPLVHVGFDVDSSPRPVGGAGAAGIGSARDDAAFAIDDRQRVAAASVDVAVLDAHVARRTLARRFAADGDAVRREVADPEVAHDHVGAAVDQDSGLAPFHVAARAGAAADQFSAVAGDVDVGLVGRHEQAGFLRRQAGRVEAYARFEDDAVAASDLQRARDDVGALGDAEFAAGVGRLAVHHRVRQRRIQRVGAVLHALRIDAVGQCRDEARVGGGLGDHGKRGRRPRGGESKNVAPGVGEGTMCHGGPWSATRDPFAVSAMSRSLADSGRSRSPR